MFLLIAIYAKTLAKVKKDIQIPWLWGAPPDF